MSLVPDGSWRRVATVLAGVSAVLLCAATFASSAEAISGILGTTGFGTIGPVGIAVDSAGNIYTANYGSNNVSKITPGGTSTILAATGTGPYGITVDSAGNIYTANYGSSNVSKITPGGTSTILAATGAQPEGIAVDSAGNIYTANYISSDVSKITPGGTSTILAATGTGPYGIAVDSAGNIYTANYNSRDVSKITPTVTNGTPDIFAAPPARPSAPTAAAGGAGSGAATVTVTANPISAAFGTPSSYTVSATEDASKQCIVTSPTTSCSVTGLTIGAAYTFTARANLNSWQTAASAASNSVTPAAAVPDPTPTPKPAKPAVTWSSSAKAKSVTAVITPVAGVTYTLTATSGRKTKKGSCKNITIKKGKKKVARRSCTVKLAKGKWLASVTPAKGAVKGPANTKRYTFK